MASTAPIKSNDKFSEDDNVFIVGDQRQRARQHNLDNKNRKATKDIDDEEKKQQLILENSNFDKMKNFIGPCYLGGVLFGIFKGTYVGTRMITFKNRPKKLIATSMINIIGKNSSKYANAGGCICLLYSFIKQSMNYLFDDDMENLSMFQKQIIFGSITGALFKSTKGYKAMILGATLCSSACGSLQLLSDYKLLPSFIPI